MKRIYLYLFVFSLAINVFLYVSSTNIMKEKESEIERLEKKIERQNDSIIQLKNQLLAYEK
ncbi:hypothetical protein AB4865_10025 [Capnocytophaga sp. ARDL2]|uniref:hypothetical protein n=1 Tax=Capnocytophaga sp. ARDL2 TaxID=3238809 RepID=UPI0035571725